MPYGPGTRVNFSEEQERALSQQLKQDPRVLAYLKANPRIRRITGEQLRALGYDVPDNVGYSIPARAGGNLELGVSQGVIDDGFASLGEKLVNVGAGAITGYGAGTIVNDLVNGGPSASNAGGAVNDTAPNISSPEGYANAVDLGRTNPVSPGNLPFAPGSVPGTGGGGGSQVPQTSQGIADQLRNMMDSPGDLAALASLIPLLSGLGGGGDNPFGDDAMNEELTKGLAAQRQRFEQAQPVYDTLVNMSYGMSPTRYRGAAPAGYPQTARAAPSGAYQYQSPRFG
jgi:hypothetical protein